MAPATFPHGEATLESLFLTLHAVAKINPIAFVDNLTSAELIASVTEKVQFTD
jgi:hypothetical protein